MSYQALYRVWRPQVFRDVVGQEHITQTLQNALVQQKFSHAYLFSGPRGTGKTSAAKIIAKAINCEKAPVAEPCNECDSCKGITNGTISDVIEIDAASNNGVDEIRDIRDKVKYAPSSVKYKVYIIDEVHMLSIGAFNALLKTLEEPPKHVIFILATTEPHKIPLTIISRCQRFDFRRISLQSMVNRMNEIISAQHVEVDEEALHHIARAAEGGMRDALSLLDQAISFSDEKVTSQDVLAITGAVSQDFLAKTAKALVKNDVVEALQAVDQLIKLGKEPLRFIEDLIFYFRDMLMFQTAPNLEEVMERAMVDHSFRELSEQTPASFIYKAIEGLNESQQEMKWTNHPKIFLELALVKICQHETPSVGEQATPQGIEPLLQRITQLEMQLKRIQEQGVKVSQAQESQSAREKKPARRGTGRTLQIPLKRIKEMLQSASKQDLHQLKGRWGEIMERLKKQKISAHATLIDSEPVAASKESFVLAFKYEIHCKMAGENRDIIERIVLEVTSQSLSMLEIPYEEWKKVKEDFIRNQNNVDTDKDNQHSEEEDPLISEAMKLVGEELIEIKD